jgi:hypothetical protein
MDQALRCSGVGAVIAPLRRVDERDSRRLQLAAESSGVSGFILRPANDRARTFAAVRMKVDCRMEESDGGETSKHQNVKTSKANVAIRCFDVSTFRRFDVFSHPSPSRFCCITLLKVREGRPVGPILVDLHHETGDGPLRSVPGNRSAAG